MQPQQPGQQANGVAGGAPLPQAAGGASPAQPGATGTTTTPANRAQVNGGRFDFDDGGTYCGGWEDGKAHGHGVCTGPKGQGAYSGSWHYGFEVSGVYMWPSGSTYEGQWQNGKRHGLGVEMRGRWLYRGEWTQGFKGRYGVRQSTTSTARYEGTWASGLQDGYGSETYADSGTYQGQWLRGMRHGYGVRASAPFGLASHYKPPKQVRASMTSLRSADGGPVAAPTPEPTDRRDRRVDDSRGGFVLKARSDDPPARRKSLTEKSLKKGILSGLMRKQKSTGDLVKHGTGGSIRSNASSTSWMSTESSQSQASASVHTDSNASFVIEDEQMDASVTETYLGEWKNDKRTGFGISERSDGLRYEGEWFNNRKYGYGVTTFRDGNKEEGKYKNNVLITSQKKKHLFLIRSAKFRERIEAAVNAAQRASKIALQKQDIAISRTATARGKAELADIAAIHAKEDCEIALQTAKQFAPDFQLPGLDRIPPRSIPKYDPPPQDTMPGKSILHKSQDQAKPPAQMPGNETSTAAPTTTTTTTNVSQMLRRPSMKPVQNQLGQPPNQNQLNNQGPGPLPNQMTNQDQNLGSTTQNQPNSYPQGNQGQLGNSLPNPYQPGQPYPGNQYIPPNAPFPQNLQGYSMGPNQVEPLQQPYPQNLQGYPNQSHYANQQIMFPISPVMYGPMTLAQMNQFGPQLYGGTVPTPYGPDMNPYNTQQLYGQPPQTNQTEDSQKPPSATSIRRNSRVLSQQDRPSVGNIGQTLNDRLDHYKRPPSRDSSVDRYARAHSRIMGSRQPSVDKTMSPPPPEPTDRSARGPSAMRAATPLNGSAVGSGAATPTYPPPSGAQFEGALLKNRGLGQDILPSPGQPKRTESLYVTPARGPAPSGGTGGGGVKDVIRTVPAFAATAKGRATL
ncbi:junctophilin-1 [Orussus abietinus]|uniref:junctophilin-1 n=1 Tax=Orussus abietinus TaxID=222816 RepID=UPI000C715B01|nr:junctophilin-1 [Orussus abietinus]